MNVNSVASLLPSYWQTTPSTSTVLNPASASSVQQQADGQGISPATQFLNTLRQLQTQSPQEFQAIISEMTGQPQQVSSTASANGSTPQANQLAALLNHFS